ncbi:hypothetical protein U1Q18_032423 [Sarracenia purpurea var. burkii]
MNPSNSPVVQQLVPANVPVVAPVSLVLIPNFLGYWRKRGRDLSSSDQVAHNPTTNVPFAPAESDEEILLTISSAILHLIDKHYSVELACGNLSILRLRQGDNVVVVLVRVVDEIQWPLTKNEATIKLDELHYFFSLRAPKESRSDSSSDESNDKGSRKVSENRTKSDLLDGTVANEISLVDLKSEKKVAQAATPKCLDEVKFDRRLSPRGN